MANVKAKISHNRKVERFLVDNCYCWYLKVRDCFKGAKTEMACTASRLSQSYDCELRCYCLVYFHGNVYKLWTVVIVYGEG